MKIILDRKSINYSDYQFLMSELLSKVTVCDKSSPQIYNVSCEFSGNDDIRWDTFDSHIPNVENILIELKKNWLLYHSIPLTSTILKSVCCIKSKEIKDLKLDSICVVTDCWLISSLIILRWTKASQKFNLGTKMFACE